MPYPKKYDRTDILDKAVEVFRRKGYNGTSTADLTTELGINRKSMYAEFGSKQGLFDAALERYASHNLARVLALVEAPNAELDQIKDAFRGYARASEGRFRGLGCLMCNTAVERAGRSEATEKQVADYFDRFTGVFRNALANSVRSGAVAASHDLDELARFLTTCVIGISASIRAEAPSEQIWATYHVVVRTLDGLRVEP